MSRLLEVKLLGLAIIAIGAVTIPITGGDITCFVMTLFFGLAAMTAKEKDLE